MREIKFRAWNKKEKWMDGVWLIDFEHRLLCFTNHNQDDMDNYILMQFTGLKDSKGIEIYEGDIVSINSDDDNWTDTVISDKNWLELKSYKNKCVTNCCLYEHSNIVEVIGNIHEERSEE